MMPAESSNRRQPVFLIVGRHPAHRSGAVKPIFKFLLSLIKKEAGKPRF